MDSLKQYNFWLESNYFDNLTKQELLQIKEDEKEIEERFYKDLEFGTGGLRGILGAGTNRMNIYTVRKASQGLSNYINSKGSEVSKRGLVIAYDSRNFSPEFALEAAKVFCGNGIPAYLFDELRPTPELSFAVRHLNAAGGIVVTASHNPKEYNGYKVYGDDGAQMSVDDSDAVISEINKLKDIADVKLMDKDEATKNGLLHWIGEEIDNSYISNLKTVLINPGVIEDVGSTMNIVFTPLHGTGNKPIRRILNEVGFNNVHVVKEQELPDGNFSTVSYPNPEEKDVFSLAIKLAQEIDAELIIGTDPDADRMGVLVKSDDGEYNVLTGNQTGCLILEYMLSQMDENDKIPNGAFIVKTIVTTELARKIAEHYKVELVEVLTGFKFIGEKIRQLDEFGSQKYIFGFEESYGYLAGTFARDKDAVVSSLLTCEMAAYYKRQGLNLYDALQKIYKKYGFTKEDITTFTLKGKDGLEKISAAMDSLRSSNIRDFGKYQATAVRDYTTRSRKDYLNDKEEKIDLPKSNVLYYEFENAWFCVRPSGTEPKIKIYYGITSNSASEVERDLVEFKKSVLSIIEKLL